MPRDDIHISVVHEDALSAVVAEAVLRYSSSRYVVYRKFPGRGSGYIRSRVGRFNAASRHVPHLVLIDLDTAECPPTLLRDLLPQGLADGMLLRIPVREVEAWLLADHTGFGSYLGVGAKLVSRRPEELDDPKAHLFWLTKRSRRRSLKDGLLPSLDSTAKIGPNYNAVLMRFVNDRWDIGRACDRAPSLLGTVEALRRYAAQH